jgi:hypothetical protein
MEGLTGTREEIISAELQGFKPWFHPRFRNGYKARPELPCRSD